MVHEIILSNITNFWQRWFGDLVSKTSDDLAYVPHWNFKLTIIQELPIKKQGFVTLPLTIRVFYYHVINESLNLLSKLNHVIRFPVFFLADLYSEIQKSFPIYCKYPEIGLIILVIILYYRKSIRQTNLTNTQRFVIDGRNPPFMWNVECKCSEWVISDYRIKPICHNICIIVPVLVMCVEFTLSQIVTRNFFTTLKILLIHFCFSSRYQT